MNVDDLKKIINIDAIDEYKKALLVQYFIVFLTLTLCVIVNLYEKKLFNLSTIAEFVAILVVGNFYFKTIRNRNYSYWGITFLFLI